MSISYRLARPGAPPSGRLQTIRQPSSQTSKLRNVLDRHVDAIRTRWGKKSGKELQAVAPRYVAADSASSSSSPHLNFEDLSGPRSLLVLFNAREMHRMSLRTVTIKLRASALRLGASITT